MIILSGDLWVLSPDFDFDPDRTYTLRSAYFGPSSGGELELATVTAYVIFYLHGGFLYSCRDSRTLITDTYKHTCICVRICIFM